VDKELRQIHDGVLGDIAPTILELMGNWKASSNDLSNSGFIWNKYATSNKWFRLKMLKLGLLMVLHLLCN
jgi:hypothetical protein